MSQSRLDPDESYAQFARALGAAVRRARSTLKKTKEDLAHESALSVRQVSEIENGSNPELITLWRIAASLGIGVDDLMAQARDQTSATG